MLSRGWLAMVRMRIVEERRASGSGLDKWTVAKDFPSYRCTICQVPLRYAEEAYRLNMKVHEKHGWACKACLQERALIW